MRVSIVTISFNQREFLERTMRSVIGQDYPDIQYIVCDPGSSDGSRELIEAMGEGVDVRVFEKDAGPADGLNKGFAHADGEIYGYLNSDDVLLPGAVGRAVKFLNEHPEYDAVSAHATVIDENDRALRTSHSMPFDLTRYAYGACIVNQPSTFFRASAFRRTGGFNVANRCNWDGELWVDMAMTGARFALVNELWSGYRLHGDSITGTGKMAEIQRASQLRLFKKIMGREMTGGDTWKNKMYRALRLIENPRNITERLLRGRIYGRMSGK